MAVLGLWRSCTVSHADGRGWCTRPCDLTVRVPIVEGRGLVPEACQMSIEGVAHFCCSVW